MEKAGKPRSVEAVKPRPIDPSQLGLPLDNRGRISWRQVKAEPDEISNQMIENASRVILDSGFDINRDSLSQAGMYSLTYGIRRIYPGGFTALRTTLDLPTSKRPDGYWSDPKNVEKSALQAMEQGIKLTQRELNKAGLSSLVAAFNQYPGGIYGLKRKLKVHTSQRPHNYWTAEKIENESREFVAREGAINSHLLREKDRNDLDVAIFRRYPRSMNGLRERLGLPQVRVSHNHWTPEVIESEVREFFQQHGKIGANFLAKKNRGDLRNAIYRNYPGGLTAIYELFGISPAKKPTGFWKPEIIEDEARKFFEEYGSLRSTLLEDKRLDLYHAIYRYYPGRLSALRKNLGIPGPDNSSPLSSDEANQWLKELVGEE